MFNGMSVFAADLFTSSHFRITLFGYSIMFLIFAFILPLSFLIPVFVMTNSESGIIIPFIVGAIAEFFLFIILCGPTTYDFNMENGVFLVTKRYCLFFPFSHRYLIQDIARFDLHYGHKHAFKMICTMKNGHVVNLDFRPHNIQKK